MRRRTPPSRSGLALAVSIAAHAGLLGALILWRVAPPAPGPAPMVVTLQERAPSAARPLGPPPARVPPGAGRAEPGAVAGGVPVAGPDATGVAVSWLHGLAAGPVDLTPRLPGGAPASVGTPEPTGEQVLGGRLAGLMEGLRAEDLTRYPDASWTDLRDALAAGFLAPDRALELARKVTGSGGGGPNAFGSFVGAYGDALERYGRSGSTLPAGPDVPGDRENLRAAERTVAAAGAIGSPERAALAQAIDGLDGQVWPAEPSTRFGGLVAVVAVRLDASGAVTGSRLVARSGSAEYDAASLAQAERLAGRELSRRLAGTETEWAFSTEVRLRPATSGAALQFDATFKPTGFAYPLQRAVRTRVELRAIRRG